MSKPQTIKTSVGTLVRSSGSNGATYSMGCLVEADRAFSGTLKSLRKIVREKIGEAAEAEVVKAANLLRGK